MLQTAGHALVVFYASSVVHLETRHHNCVMLHVERSGDFVSFKTTPPPGLIAPSAQSDH